MLPSSASRAHARPLVDACWLGMRSLVFKPLLYSTQNDLPLGICVMLLALNNESGDKPHMLGDPTPGIG